LRRRERAEDHARSDLSLSFFSLSSLSLSSSLLKSSALPPPPIVYFGGGARLVFLGGLEFEDAPL